MKKTTYSLALIFLTMVSQYVFAANVASVSEVNFAQYGKEDAYWVVTVTCNNQSKHSVQRKTDQEIWCPKNNKGNTDVCNENKKTAFENVCADAYANTPKTNTDTPTVKAVEEKKTPTVTPQQLREAKEKELVEQKIREAEQKIQQRIFAEDSIALLQQEIRLLDEREQEIQQRIIFINEIIRSEEEGDEE